MNRRKFLKYAGAGAVTVGASAIGLDYVLTSRPNPLNQGTTSSNQTATTTSKFNSPPNAYFTYKPKYLNSTDQQTVAFTNLSTDLDNDPLKYAWFVDDQLVSENKDYSAKLPVGEHLIRLNVSDSQAGDVTEKTVTVDPDQMYPAKPLYMKYKGMKYAAGRASPDLLATPKSIPTAEEMDEQLTTIHNELGCNAIYIQAGAGYEDNLLSACGVALQKGFDRVYADQEYRGATLDDTAEKLRDFAPRILDLRRTSDSIVWAMGCEFSYAIRGIFPGDTFRDKVEWVATHHSDYISQMRDNIPKIFGKILAVIKSNYPHPVAYAAEVNEAAFVPWYEPVLESVCTNAYMQDAYGANEQWLISYLSRFKRFGKPVIASEFGSKTFKDAGACAECNHSVSQDEPYDEVEQAKYVERYCNTLNKANITGAFYYIYNEEWDKGFGLYNGKKRKKGFYMYKSYQRTS